MEYWVLSFPLLLLMPGHNSAQQSHFTIDKVRLTIDPGSKVETGTYVTLRCEVTVSRSNTHHLTQNFSFFLGGQVVNTKNSSNTMVEYQLQPATASNTGTYHCQVRIQNKVQTSQPHTLTVTGLQTPQLKVRSDIVYEGGEVSATCSALEESGMLIFQFFENSSQVLKRVAGTSNSVTTTLTMKQVGETHLHCSFHVATLPEAGQSNRSNAVKVIVKEWEITPTIQILPQRDVVEGDRLEIKCMVKGAPSGVEVFLTKGVDLLHHSHTGFTHSFSARAQDSGNYVCKSEKQSVQKTSNDTLNVTELFSKPVLRLEPRVVFEGDQFTLSCKSAKVNPERITPKDVTYSIYRDQLRVIQTAHYSTTASSARSSNYSCLAEAKGINKSSATLMLQAKVPVSVPVITVLGQVVLGRPFQVRCESAEGSPPVRYSLLSAGREVAVSLQQGPRHRALFNLSSINHREEIHTFTCRAKNTHTPKTSAPLRAPVIEPVSRPVLTTVPEGSTVTEGTDLRLVCSVLQGTVPITFTWHHGGSTTPLFSKQFSSMRGSYTLQGISREQRGIYSCSASNEANESKGSQAVPIGVNLAVWKKALIAVFCILLALAIVIVLATVMRKSSGPLRRKRAAELSVKPAGAKSGDPMRMSLTLGIEDNSAPNASPGVMGRSVWSDNASGSESDDPGSAGDVGDAGDAGDVDGLRYTEVVHPPPGDPGTVHSEPMTLGSETMCPEVQDSPQACTTQSTEALSLEYAQLNRGDPAPV